MIAKKKKILKARLNKRETEYILRKIVQNLQMRQKASRMPLQCHTGALFNRPSHRSPHFSRGMHLGLTFLIYNKLKKTYCVKLHVNCRFLSGRDANDFALVERELRIKVGWPYGGIDHFCICPSARLQHFLWCLYHPFLSCFEPALPFYSPPH